MSEDIFRSSPTLDHWLEGFNLDRIPGDERERFMSNIRTLSKNPTLNWLLSRLEATQVMALANMPGEAEEQAQQARIRLLVIRELRRTIHGFAEESEIEGQKLSKNRGLT